MSSHSMLVPIWKKTLRNSASEANIESVQATTRARYSMGDIQFPIEGLDS